MNIDRRLLEGFEHANMSGTECCPAPQCQAQLSCFATVIHMNSNIIAQRSCRAAGALAIESHDGDLASYDSMRICDTVATDIGGREA